MISSFRADPGPCPIDDSPHTTCCAPGVATGSAITVSLLGASAPVTVTTPAPPPVNGAPAPPPLRAVVTQATLPPNQFTTATYRRKRK